MPDGLAHSPFEQDWWLEAVAPGRWGAITVERSGAIAGRLPYVHGTRVGFRVLVQPPLVPHLGPRVRPGEGGLQHRLAVEKDILGELVAALPPAASHRVAFAPDAMNALPFYWEGYDVSLRYTYRIDAGGRVEDVWAGLLKDVRKKIRRAERVLAVSTDVDLSDALDVHRRIFDRQALAAPFGDAVARRLDQACTARGMRTLLGAVDAEGRLHAVLYTVHDARWTYLLYGGPAPEFTTSGAYPLIVWEAVRRAIEAGRGVDFLGSMMEQVERHNRSFGAQRIPYVLVDRETSALRWIRATRAVARDAARWGADRLRRPLVGR